MAAQETCSLLKTGRFLQTGAIRIVVAIVSALLLPSHLAGCGGGQAATTGTTTAPTTTTPQTLRAGADKHGIAIGTAADAAHLSETVYASTLSSEYSLLEPENEMKFSSIHPAATTYNYADADALVAFAQAHSMQVRGHNLVWHEQVPDWVKSPATPWTPATLSQVLSDHIANVAGRYKGKLFAWDVVNEPFNDDGTIRSSIWYDSPGIGFAGQGTKTIEQALVWARAADPSAKLFVNEYGAEVVNAKSDAVYAMAQDFVKRGVPLGGIGMQLHGDTGFDTSANLSSLDQNIQRLGALGLEVHFTEIDVRIPDNTAASLAAQAKTYQDLLNVCLSQTACKVFQTWGFTDKYSWVPSFFTGYGWALPFDDSYGKKPAYTSLLQKLQ
jgi:endo-1,4-beta-xylanase